MNDADMLLLTAAEKALHDAAFLISNGDSSAAAVVLRHALAKMPKDAGFFPEPYACASSADYRAFLTGGKCDFLDGLEAVAAEIHRIAVDRGWWPDEKTPEEVVACFRVEDMRIGKGATLQLSDISDRLLDLVKRARETASRSEAEMIALHHSELSEALEEGVRRGNPEAVDLPGYSAMEEQFADLLIRVLDHCHHRRYRIGEAVLAKIEVNRRRPYKHGGKVL